LTCGRQPEQQAADVPGEARLAGAAAVSLALIRSPSGVADIEETEDGFKITFRRSNTGERQTAAEP